MMERDSTLGHRISQEKKNEFDLAFNTVQSKILKDQGVKITKEDYLEALISFGEKVSWKELKIIVELA